MSELSDGRLGCGRGEMSVPPGSQAYPAGEIEKSGDEAGSRSVVVRCLWVTREVAG